MHNLNPIHLFILMNILHLLHNSTIKINIITIDKITSITIKIICRLNIIHKNQSLVIQFPVLQSSIINL
eukprot:UN05677